MSLNVQKPAEDICCENDVSNLDEKYLGKKVPTRFATGPIEPKKCTDIICCVIFLTLIIGMIVAGFLHYPNSKISSMTTPRDSEGNVCGKSEKTKDYPYLYMIKFSSPYRSVCVKECLRFDYNQIRYNSTGTNLTYIRPVYFDNFTDAVKEKNSSAPANSKSPNITSIDDPRMFDYDPVTARGYYSSSQYYDYLEKIQLRCRTNSNVSSCSYNPNNKVYYYDSTPVLFNVCLPLQQSVLGYADFVGDLKAGWVSDLKNTWWIILISVISAVIIGIIFLAIATYFLPCLLWTQIVLAVIGLISLGIIGLFFAADVNGAHVNRAIEKANEHDATSRARWETLKDRIWILWVVSIVLIILGIFIAWITFTNRRGIGVALGVLRFASVFITKNMLVVAVAIFAFCLQVVTFLLTIWLLLILHTSGDYVVDNTGSPLPKFKYTAGKWVLWYLGIFTVYWAVIFWNNFADITCAATASNYYFNTGTGVITSAFKSLFWHSGSVAFASLILLPVTIVQVLFGWFYAAATDDHPNVLQKWTTKICCCIVYPYQKLFNRTREDGLAMVYFASCNFCPSSKRVHYLHRRVGERVGNVSMVGFLFKISGVLSITAINFYIFRWIIMDTNYFTVRVQNVMVPLFAIFLFSLIVASLFISIYSTACDALLMCYLIELDLDKKPRHPDLNNTLSQIEKGGYSAL